MTFGQPVNITSDERVMGGMARFFGLIVPLIAARGDAFLDSGANYSG